MWGILKFCFLCLLVGVGMVLVMLAVALPGGGSVSSRSRIETNLSDGWIEVAGHWDVNRARFYPEEGDFDNPLEKVECRSYKQWSIIAPDKGCSAERWRLWQKRFADTKSELTRRGIALK